MPFRRVCLTVLASLVFSGVATASTAREPQYLPAPADQSWAESIALSGTDFGSGWKSMSRGGTMTGSGTDSATCSSPDESDLVLTGGWYSPDFMRADGTYISSAAVVWQTPEQAQADWERNVQAGLMSCLASDLEASSTKRVNVVVTGREQLHWPALAPRSAAYRISLVLKTTVKVRKKTRRVSLGATVDFIAVGSGRATAMLWTLSYNRRPLGDLAKQRYAMTMVQRMAVDPAAAK